MIVEKENGIPLLGIKITWKTMTKPGYHHYYTDRPKMIVYGSITFTKHVTGFHVLTT